MWGDRRVGWHAKTKLVRSESWPTCYESERDCFLMADNKEEKRNPGEDITLEHGDLV